MPALFAYLIALGLLIGGGYGALSWLAAPEPIKVAAKAKSKPPPHYEANSDRTTLASSAQEAGQNDKAPAAVADSDKVGSAPNDRPSAGGSEGTERHEALPEASSPAADKHVRAAHAEIAPLEQTPQAKQARAERPVSSATTQTEASASWITTPKVVKRSRLRQASRHLERPAEKRRLTLMTLRTVQYPDGRRVSQLLPYRGPRHALAFAPDD